MKRRILAFGLVVLVLTSSVAFAASDFTVTIPGSIETPEKTVTVEGDSYTISSVARVEKGDTLSVETNGPTDEEYRVYVHGVKDGTRQVQDTKFVAADDDGTVSFDTTKFAPGSYSVSIYDADTGRYYSPNPVVVPAFETNVVLTEIVTVDREFNVNVSTNRIESGPSISSVELVFTQGETTKRVDASESDGNYTASVSLSESGDWDVYAAVKGTEDAPRGEKELIGISDPIEMSVQAESATTTTTTTTTAPTMTSTSSSPPSTNSGTGGNDGDNNGGEETTEPKTPTTSQSSTTEAPSTSTSTPSSTSPTTSPSNTGTQLTPTDNPETSTIAPSTSEVIEPNTRTTDDSSSGGSAGGLPLALVALLATIGLLLRDY